MGSRLWADWPFHSDILSSQNCMNKVHFSLVDFVERLVRVHECVIVPGLGGFIIRDHQASFNRFNGQLRPRNKSIFFNDILRQDDGLLLNAICSDAGISRPEAQDFVQKEVAHLLQRCAGHEQQAFGSLGSFYLNQHDKLFFLPSATLNLADVSFGLKPVTLETAVETLTREIRKPLIVQDIPEKEVKTAAPIPISPNREQADEQRLISWKVAAAIAILSLTTAAGIRLSSYFREEPDLILASSLNTETLTMSPKIVPEKPEQPKLSSGTTATSKVPAKSTKQVPVQASRQNENYKIVSGCFITEKAAIEELKKLAAKGIAAYTGRPLRSSLYRVMVGEAATAQQAAVLATKFTGKYKIRVHVELLHLP